MIESGYYPAGAYKNAKYRYIALYEYTLDGHFVTSWKNSTEAANAYGIAGSNIRKCSRGEIKTIGGRIFLKATESIQDRLLKINNRKHKSKAENV